MRSITLLTAICILFASSLTLATESPVTYGKGVSAPDTLLVSTVLTSPDAFVGKTIRVTGTAVGVCKHRGCWINLASDQEGQTLRVKVKDGEIVFPPEILGETVTVEGVWTSNVIKVQPAEACSSDKEKKNPTCAVEGKDACKTVYQLSGTGAVVLAR